MRGFLAGSLVLVGVYVATRSSAAKAAEAGGNWFVSGLRRLLAADVAGIPQRKG